ncbi:glycerol-3-phosphate acyltransferase [Cohnella zeiphila]|uniref:Glycerol-3-phosphate acyltransferase n=1 Tax=Cohnella zeiphila TaxID=2761120 RepID=A0A7X0VX26_9BACL|nr:glycerol-3-phosphate acyltransferase [Cohnella zeiphila]MBB6733120.1 glycerol-3-phosphate acyltransferase [Cohnella zeiphila]
MIVIWTALAGLSGSLMFSYWLGLIARHNLKNVGDGNPGALNLWKAAGFPLGLAGIALDFLKGYVPVLLLTQNGYVQGAATIPVALAPLAGHAFSPFLKGKGGKAIAVTFGVWSALTAFEASLAYAVIQAALLAIIRFAVRGRAGGSTETDAFQVVFGLLLVGVYLYVRSFPKPLLWVWLGNFLLLAYTHRRSLLALYHGRFKHSA